jgi:arylsulfatase A-like enzyme
MAPGSRLAVAGIVLAGVLPACAPPARKPNVILISIDTLRADRLNSYGYRARELSPALDRLAADGVLFERHIAASPWTTPSHLSLLTSLQPSAHGVTASLKRLGAALRRGADVDRLAPEHETLAEVLSRRGYVTAAFTGGVTMDPRFGFDQGFATYDTSMAKLAEWNFAALLEWIRAHRQRPYFLFWHTFEVHAPYLHDDFAAGELAATEAARLAKSLARARHATSEGLPSPNSLLRVLEAQGLLKASVCVALYDAGVRSADRWIGRLVERLAQDGQYDQTLIVVTSDHGEQLGERAGPGGNPARDGRFYNAHGTTTTEEMVRVPLILKLPAQAQAGQRVAAISRAIDVMPTILDVLGFTDGPRAMQGASLRTLWEQPGAEPREALSEALSRARESKSLRTLRHKYVLSFKPAGADRFEIPARPERAELYDLLEDPGETRNLLSPPSAEAAALASRLDAQLRRVASERRGTPARSRLDPEALERLKALGYLQ